MEVKSCKKCRRLFQYTSGPVLCVTCRKELEEIFQKVKQYIKEHQGASIMEVSEELDVSVRLIEKFLREGRLEVAPNSPIFIRCERCDKEIKSGHYCDECKKQLEAELKRAKNSLINQPGAEVKAKMRFLQVDKVRPGRY